MLETELFRLLKGVREGKIEIEAAVEKLKRLPFSDLGFAKPDRHRALRKGFPEVIYCAGKTPAEIEEIARELLEGDQNILATRAEESHYLAMKKISRAAKYHKRAKIITVERRRARKVGFVLVLTAGTSDIPVAEEAALTAELMGSRAERLYDVGVAGLHRLLAHGKELSRARVIVVVAGMEGALPSIVGGLVACPVIAVPTSVGYGASFGGLAALLTMLNSCAPGVGVVNIDNGFGAGYLAAVINQMADSKEYGIKEQ
ncbi:MAG: nickel pincer cofactor biosynthesis protein LarB [Actinomycetota bacterium]|nr:nickel pincer cofactor biosynthesis protein LarB [Actinomycetota bacterium]